MKNNILPPVIENLLSIANDTFWNSQMEEGSRHPIMIRLDKLRIAIQAVEEYKKQLEKDDLITLVVESMGDRSTGIGKEQIEIKMWRGQVAPDADPDNGKWICSNGGLSLRKEMKELFADTCSVLFATNVGNVYFEDECPDCNKTLFKKS